MLYLVTGGSGSGKSEYAEALVQKLRGKSGQEASDEEKQGSDDGVWYLATMIPYGAETEKKIARHRKMRKDKGFLTKECYLDLKGFVREEEIKGNRPSVVLLECMSNLTANEMFEETGAGSGAFEAVKEGIEALCDFCGQVVVVTNEVCSETAQDSPEMYRYKEVLGKINCWMAKRAVQVTEVVYGIPLSVKEKKVFLGSRERSPESDVWMKEEMVKQEKRKGVHLIVGGAFQGKTAYVKSAYPDLRWCDGSVCKMDDIWEAEGILHLEAWISRWMRGEENKARQQKEKISCQAEEEVGRLVRRLIETNPDRVIVCTEIGYGLVPVDAFDRAYRETVGRICTGLAGKAAAVDRIVCGIDTRIKEM